eukprot:INCI12388.2.p1 GENE.INCI12388.2~~INCI12388.2.p1  ORF type:complete len:953 (-),score=132.02 INCI12388.2:57-2915(-)
MSWDLADDLGVEAVQPRRASQRGRIGGLSKYMSPRRPRSNAFRSARHKPALNLAQHEVNAYDNGNSEDTGNGNGLSLGRENVAKQSDEPRRQAPSRQSSLRQRRSLPNNLAPLNVQGSGGLILARLTPTPKQVRIQTPHASGPSSDFTSDTNTSGSSGCTRLHQTDTPNSTASSSSIEAREVVHGAWPRGMTLEMAVRSLTDPKCVIDQQCHLAFLLCLPCFATEHTAQPLFQHQESIKCILYNSVDQFVRFVLQEFAAGTESANIQGSSVGLVGTGATTTTGVSSTSSQSTTRSGRPHIHTIIRRAKVMKLLSLWIAQRGGETDLTNHQTARAQILDMLTKCPSMVERNRSIADQLVDRIRVVNQNSLRTVVTIVHALHQRVGQVRAPKILKILKAKLSERFGADIVEYHWESIVAVLQERPTRSLGHLKGALRGPGPDLRERSTASPFNSRSRSSTNSSIDSNTAGEERVHDSKHAVRTIEAEIICLPKPWWEYKMSSSIGGSVNDEDSPTVVWRSGCDHIAVRDHPTRWSHVICRLGMREEVKEIARIYADFHYWIRIFVLDDAGNLQAGWVCIDNYFDCFHPDFSCAATRELAASSVPGRSISMASTSSHQGGASRRGSSIVRRGSSLSMMSKGDSSLFSLYHNTKSNARLAKEHDLSTSLLATVIMNPSKHRDFAKILAAQLTLIDVGVLKRMQLRELIGQRWTKKYKNEESPYVLELTRDYNNRVSWVVRILQGKTHKYRRLAYSFMVKVADELLESGNFNAAGQIGHGFASPALGKLDIFTNQFEKSKPAAITLQKRIEFLKALFHDKDNYARYRLEYAFREQEGPKGSGFMIPCFGIFLGDMFKLDDKDPWILGTCPRTGEPLLNLPKASATYSMLSQTLRVADMTDASKALHPHVGLAADVQREIEHSTAFIDQLKKQRELNREKARKNNSRINKLKDLGYYI